MPHLPVSRSETMDKPNFFSEGSPFLAHPLLTAERTNKEIDFVEAALSLKAGTRILDVGCGFGRHSIELARRGYRVVGMDAAAAMIKAARERAMETAVSIDFQVAKAEQFTTSTLFDAAICLFTSLGQITDSGENSALVYRVCEALKPGGMFLVEVPQRDPAVAQLKAAEQFGNGANYTAVTRAYNSTTQTVFETFTQVSGVQKQVFTLHYRLFDRQAVTALLQEAGFVIHAAYGSYAGDPLTTVNDTMLIVAKKTGIHDA
jgi:2-polyprenyl-3-methyl-5-hydroxy-6-metoxy-1,4-benzoquinol methylase